MTTENNENRKYKPNYPLAIVRELYHSNNSPQVRQALLRYLLHYQHGNAEYTQDECKRLGYLAPLCAPQQYPGYYRTEFNRALELIKPWFDKTFKDLFDKHSGAGKHNSFRNFKPVSSAAIRALQAFYIHSHVIVDLQGYLDNKQSLAADGRKVIVLQPLAVDRFEQALMELLANKQLSHNNTKYAPKLLLMIQHRDIPCQLLNGCVVKSANKCSKLVYETLEQLFDKDVNKLLNSCGVIADRMAINRLLTVGLGQTESSFTVECKLLGISTKTLNHTCVLAYGDVLPQRDYADPSCQFYYRAIKRWHEHLFMKHKEVAAFIVPLLNSQIYGWLREDADIIALAKAYQNTAECVMLCLEAFPEIANQVNFVEAFEQALYQTKPKCYTSAGLYTFGMEPIFDILRQVLAREEYQGQRPVVSCLNQNYFETTTLVGKLLGQKAEVNHYGKLSDITEVPDILITDIHPNNAAQDLLVENNITHWVEKRLTDYPDHPLIVIIDCTLNHLDDIELQTILQSLESYVVAGKLEVFGTQSLAKLIQLGADNFSGGSCYYLGQDKKKPIFPPALPQKQAFYGLLLQHFQDLTKEYFARVRKNTEWMYQHLNAQFEEIWEYYWSDAGMWEDAVEKTNHSRFCPVKVKLNFDDGAVYVALGFDMFFERLAINAASEKEKIVKQFRNLLQKLAEIRGLPITARQSFGFSLSNMSCVVDAIRFSIGVESEKLLIQYCSLLNDFGYALAKLVMARGNKFDCQEFKEQIINTYQVQYSKSDQKGAGVIATIPIMNDSYNEYGDEEEEQVGKAKVYYQSGCLSLIKKDTNKKVTEVQSTEVAIQSGSRYRHLSGEKQSPSDVFRFLFHARVFKAKSVRLKEYPSKNGVCINTILGFLETTSLFHNSSEMTDESSQAHILFRPNFEVTLSDSRVFSGELVYVYIDGYETPVKISKLDSIRQDQIYTQCARYHCKWQNYNNCGVLLTFGDRKPNCNYGDMLVGDYKKGGLAEVIARLQEYDLDNLPLLHDQLWYQYAPNAKGRVDELLKEIGFVLALRLTKEDSQLLLDLNDKRLVKPVLQGIISGVIHRSLELKYQLKDSAKQAILQLLSLKNIERYFDYYTIDQWVSDLSEAKSNDNRLIAYYEVLFAIIKIHYVGPGSLCNIDTSLTLKHLACQMTVFPELNNYLVSLETQLPATMESITYVKALTWYLGLFLYYPLSDEVKRGVLEALAKVDDKLKLQWILHYPEFYYKPLDSFHINMAAGPEDLIATKDDQAALMIFFRDTGLRATLLEQLNNVSDESIITAAERWATICDDNELRQSCRNVKGP